MSDPNSSASSSSSSPATPPSVPARRSKLKVILLSLGGVLVLLLLVVLLIPTLLSTGAGNRFLLGQVNSRIVGSVSAQSIHLGWTGGQRIEGLELKDANGGVVLTVRELTANDVSLIGVAMGRYDLGLIRIVAPDGQFVRDPQGQLNVAKALAMKEPAAPKVDKPDAGKSSSPWKLKLELVEGKTSYTDQVANSALGDPVKASDLKVNVNMTDPTSPSAEVSAVVGQGKHQGKFSASVQTKDLMTADGDLRPGTADLNATAKIEAVPMAFLQQFTGKNFLVAVAGEKIDGNVALQGKLTGAKGNVVLKTDTLDINANVESDGKTARLTKGSKAKLTVTPAAWDALTAGQDAATRAKLLAPFDIEVEINEGSVAVKDNEADLGSAAVDVVAKIGQIRLSAPAPLGEMTLADTQLTVQSKKLAEALTLSVGAKATQSGQTGTFALDGTVKDLIGADGKVAMAKLTAELTGKIIQFPLAVLDQVLAMDGALAGGLGPTLNATLGANVKPDPAGGMPTGTFSLVADAKNLKKVDIKGALDAQAVRINKTSEIAITSAHELISRLGRKFGGPQATWLAYLPTQFDELKLTFTDDVNVPRAGTAFKTAAAKATVDLTVTGITLAVPGVPEPVSVKGGKITVHTGELAKEVTVMGGFDVMQQNQPGRLDLEAGARSWMDPATGEVKLNGAPLNAKITLSGVPVALVGGMGADAAIGSPGATVQLLGPTLTGVVDVAAKLAPDQKIPNTDKLEVQLKSQYLDVQLSGATKNQAFVLAKAGVITWDLQPAGFKALLQKSAATNPDMGKMALRAPAKLTVNLATLEAPLQGDIVGALKTATTVTATSIQLDGVPMVQQVAVEGLNLDVKLGMKGRELAVIPQATFVWADGAKSTLKETTISTADMSNLKSDLQANLALYDVPVNVVQQLVGPEKTWVVLLGSKVQMVKINLNLAEFRGPAGITNVRFEPELKADGLYLKLAGTVVKGKSLTLEKDGKMWVDLTPQYFAGLAEKPLVELTKTARVNVALENLSVNLIPATQATAPGGATDKAAAQGAAGQSGWSPDLNTAVMKGTATIGSLPFRVLPDGQMVTIDDLKVDVNTPGLDKELQITAKGKTTGATAVAPGGAKAAAAPGAGAGTIDANLKLKGLKLGGEGDMVKNLVLKDGKVKLDAVPMAVVDQLMQKNGQLVGLVGPVANVDVQGDFPGAMNVAMTGELTQVNVPVNVDQERVLTLQKDATVQVRITPEFAQTQLAKLHPFLAEARSAEKPMKLLVKKEGFRAPLANFDINQVAMAGTLEIGTLHMKRGGTSKALVQALRAAGSPIQDREEFDAKFTPLVFDMKDGVVTTNDLWMDSGDLRLGAQTRVTLKGEQPQTDFLMAIPGETVHLIPHAAKRIPMDALYSAQYKGSMPMEYGKLLKTMTELIAPIAGEMSGSKEVRTGVAILSAVGSVLDKNKGSKVAGWADANWSNRPKPEVLEGTPKEAAESVAAPDKPATAAETKPGTTADKPAAKPAEPTTEDKVKGLIDIFKKDDDKDKKKKDEKKKK